MKPTPQHLAVLISLIGFGVSWPEAAFSQAAVAGFSSPALGVDAREEAIRNVLGLQEMPRASEAAHTIVRPKAAAKSKSRVGVANPGRGESVKWNRTALGVDPGGIAGQTKTRAARDVEQRDAVQAEQLAMIRSILGLGARDDVASLPSPRRVNRAGEALLHSHVAFASTPAERVKREVPSSNSSSTSASTPQPLEGSLEVPQWLSSAPAPTGEMVVEAIFGQSSAPNTPKRYHDDPLPMLADRTVFGLRREERQLPLLMLVPTMPADDAEPSADPLSAEDGTNGDDQANAIALATPSQLTADYLDPLMPLLRALRASGTQGTGALTAHAYSAFATPGVPVGLEAANDELADLAATDIDEQISSTSIAPQATEIAASAQSEAPALPLLAQMEVPQTPIISSDGSALLAMLPAVALAKSADTDSTLIAASQSLADGGSNSAGERSLIIESSITALVRDIGSSRPANPDSNDAPRPVAGDETLHPDNGGLVALNPQSAATQDAPNEAAVTPPSSGKTLASSAGISRLPMVDREEPFEATAQPAVTGKSEAIPLSGPLSARFDIFDPKMTAPRKSADAFELFTLKEAPARFDIFDPAMVAPAMVAPRVTASDRKLGALLASSESEPSVEPATGFLQAQTLPVLEHAATQWVQARLSMLALVEAPYAQAERDGGADLLISTVGAGGLAEQITPRVFEESTIEKAMAKHTLAASTPTASREILAKSPASAAAEERSTPPAGPSIEIRDLDEVRAARSRETRESLSFERETTVVTAMDELRTNPLQGELVSLSDSKLDQMRGGFETPTGLQISFGIERAVYINGNLVTTTSLNLSDLSKLTAGQVQAAGLNGASLGLIQNGPSNSFAPGQVAASSVATVVQNTLNDQKIQGVTLINATVNSLDLVKRANVQSSILNGLTDSLRR